MNTIEEKEWFLSLSKEIKLELLEKTLVEGKYGYAMELMKILLDAPISKGGIVTEEINEVFQKYISVI